MASDVPEELLESWKEIAAYLRRDVRTVQRWEKTEGLPVRRHFHDKLGSVFASKSDLDAWRQGRSLAAESEAPAPEEPAPPPAEAANSGKARQEGRRWPRLVHAGAVVVFLALAATLGWRLMGRPSGGPVSLAVLPFANLSGDPGQDYFSDGVTEELITELSRQVGDRVRILGMGSTRPYRSTGKKAGQIARELGVDHVLEGSVRREGGQVRIVAHLVRGRDEAHVWSETYDRPAHDILALQSEVAEGIAGGISQRLARPAPRAARAVSGPAHEAYLQGRFFWNKRTPADLQSALACFDKAAQLDGSYAPIHAGMADCYALLGSAEMGVMAPNDALPRAKAAVDRALALDPDLAEAHASLAYIKLIYDWDWPGAQREFRAAIRLNPSYPTAHQWYALLLSVLGRSDDALAELDKAAHLDPLSPTVKTAQAECHYFAHRYDEAILASQSALELDPGFMLAHVNLGRALAMKGDYPGAVRTLTAVWERSGHAPGPAMLLGAVHARKGDRAKALEMLDALTHPPEYGGRPLYVPALCFAAIHAGLHEPDPTFLYLEKALGERCEYLIYLGRDPLADGMRQDPRFQRVLERVGLPKS